MATPQSSQQQHAVDVWQRRAVPAYSHRNGETEAPTVLGRYWFDGSAIGLPFSALTTVIADADGTLLAWYEHSDQCWFQHLSSFTGRWWGPVPAPWEQAE